MEKQELKKLACSVIDTRADELIAFGEDIFQHPELGFKEYRTSEKIRQAFTQLGAVEITSCGITGIKAWLSKGDGPAIALLGELDAVISPQHPMADPTTGAAHACGHNAQLAALLGAAWGLSAVSKYLHGKVCLIATPAEEYIEIGWRSELKKAGILSYLGGKQQLIAEGIFDDIDMAMMLHSETDAPYDRIVFDGASSGFIGKTVQFSGQEAHAGGAPWDGINALNAATLAIMGIHANRETFRDEDCVRVHPILTKGGDLVNTVPADVHMESYVRAANTQAMQEANQKVDRAIEGAAHMVGASATICNMPGYLPLLQNRSLSAIMEKNVSDIEPDLAIIRGQTLCGSTDMGDLSHLIPVIHPTITGFSGAAHSKEFQITDKTKAYILPAKLMAATVIDLLFDGAVCAEQVLRSHPRKNKEAYFTLWDALI